MIATYVNITRIRKRHNNRVIVIDVDDVKNDTSRHPSYGNVKRERTTAHQLIIDLVGDHDGPIISSYFRFCKLRAQHVVASGETSKRRSVGSVVIYQD